MRLELQSPCPCQREVLTLLWVAVSPAPGTIPGSEEVLSTYGMKDGFYPTEGDNTRGSIGSSSSSLFYNMTFTGTRHQASVAIHALSFSRWDALSAGFTHF